MVRRIPLQRLNKRQARTYVQDNGCSLDPALNSQTPNNLLFVFDKTYQCADGKILAVSGDGTGNLYSSADDWQTELNELIELDKLEPVHILYNQISSQERFIQEVPYLISKLAEELNIDPSELDKNLESLFIIDQIIESKNRQDYIDDNDKKILGSLIAYVGEVVRVAVNGEWMIKQENRSGWEPVIVSPSGKTSSFCIMVFDELYEAEESSFHDLASMLIDSYQ
ncbi:MAG: hypothetical protein LH702_03405 [Phormidesmis sp. CAN_BIN44]|nr:hypothetical protein [Phormidesmis sp. CAN_BIN44]